MCTSRYLDMCMLLQVCVHVHMCMCLCCLAVHNKLSYTHAHTIHEEDKSLQPTTSSCNAVLACCEAAPCFWFVVVHGVQGSTSTLPMDETLNLMFSYVEEGMYDLWHMQYLSFTAQAVCSLTDSSSMRDLQGRLVH